MRKRLRGKDRSPTKFSHRSQCHTIAHNKPSNIVGIFLSIVTSPNPPRSIVGRLGIVGEISSSLSPPRARGPAIFTSTSAELRTSSLSNFGSGIERHSLAPQSRPDSPATVDSIIARAVERANRGGESHEAIALRILEVGIWCRFLGLEQPEHLHHRTDFGHGLPMHRDPSALSEGRDPQIFRPQAGLHDL